MEPGDIRSNSQQLCVGWLSPDIGRGSPPGEHGCTGKEELWSLASEIFKTRGDKATTDLPGDGVIPGFCLKSH